MIVAIVALVIGLFLATQGARVAGHIITAAIVLLLVGPARGDEPHKHRPQDLELHHKFYKTWTMPDNRAVSCCHDDDCRPAEVRKLPDGRWAARQEGDQGDFTPVPPNKEEHDRDSPDGRSHLCGRRYGFSPDGDFTVFCFKLGSGS